MNLRGWRRLLLAALVIGIGAIIVRATSPSGASGSTTIPDAPSGVTVLVATSLASAVMEMAPDDRVISGNSDALAAQVVEGVPADVVISADLTTPEALHATGFVDAPVVIARDRLVVITTAANPAGIHSLDDLTRAGVHVVIGTAASPLGREDRSAFARLGLSGALGHTATTAPDSATIMTELLLGDADAGVVYESEAHALGTKVRVIPIPAAAQPVISDAAAVVVHAPHPTAAAAFAAYLVGPDGQAYLRRYGFLAP
jgi:molybdate transport system substrate-binding protein